MKLFLVHSKKEIPHFNYVMHTAHCARNITLCPTCKEPVPKSQYDDHKKTCCVSGGKSKKKASPPPPFNFQNISKTTTSMASTKTNATSYGNEKLTNQSFSATKYDTVNSMMQEGRSYSKKELAATSSLSNSSYASKKTLNNNNSVEEVKETKMTNGNAPSYNNNSSSKFYAPKSGMLACKFCDLELPKLDLEEHENYCGSRTDKCNVCGELVMFKYKKLHEESNHGFLKLNDGKSINGFSLSFLLPIILIIILDVIQTLFSPSRFPHSLLDLIQYIR